MGNKAKPTEQPVTKRQFERLLRKAVPPKPAAVPAEGAPTEKQT